MKDKWVKWTDRAPEPANHAEVLAYWPLGVVTDEALFSVIVGSDGETFTWHAHMETVSFRHNGPCESPWGPREGWSERPTHWQPLEGPDVGP